MKNIFTFLLSTLIGLSAFAAEVAGRVTVSFYGNNDYQVYIDGRSIYAKNNRVFLHDIRPGRHTIEVYDLKRNNRRKNRAVYSSNFIVRLQYDINIVVDRNGYVRFDEHRSYNSNRNNKGWNDRDRDDDYSRNGDWDRNRDWNKNRDYDDDRDYKGNRPRNDYNRAISDAEFNRFIEKIRNQWFSKLNTAKDGLNDNYFTTYQVKEILQVFSSESDKLELAKTAYNRTVDQNNFGRLYDLFSSRGKDELDKYLKERRY